MELYKTLADRVDMSQLRWFERLCLEHANPINLLLHLLGLIIIVYGLWINVLAWVAIGIAVILIGHIYVWSISRKKGKKKK